MEFASEKITPGSVLATDEVAHWDLLEPSFDVRRINHSDAYSRNGVHTNFAESFFSRLRRMIGGQHHKVGARHLDAYVVTPPGSRITATIATAGSQTG